MAIVKYILCLIFNLQITVFAGESFYGSTALLEKLLRTQKKIALGMEDYINKEEERLEYIKRYMKIFKTESDKAMNNSEHYIGNPINAFKLFSRLSYDKDFTLNNLQNCTDPKAYFGELFKKGLDFSNVVDVSKTAAKIASLQRIYNLKTRDLADGKVRNIVPTATPMKADECFKLAVDMYNSYKFEFSLLWFKESLRRYREEKTEYMFTEFDIIANIESCYVQLDSTIKAYEWARKLLRLNPNSKSVADRINKYRKTLQINEDLRNKTTENIDDGDFVGKLEDYTKYCAEDADILGNNSERLICRYLYENHPFLKIAPIKMEYKSYDPLIVLFHEVLTDFEIFALKRAALIKLEPISNFEEDGNIAVIGHAAWLYYEEYRVVRSVLARIADMTSLDPTTAESFKVFNYGVGGAHIPHHDYVYAGNTLMRIATVLFFLTDVELGGATIFTKLGISIRPAKGTALFWMNCNADGVRNEALQHAECPVGYGSKWTASLWIVKPGQEFVIPCKEVKQKDGTFKQIYSFKGRTTYNLTYF